jgi:hypothetical protein
LQLRLAHALLAGTVLETIQAVSGRRIGNHFSQVIVTAHGLILLNLLLLFHLFDHLHLFLVWLGVDLRVQSRLLAEFLVALDEESTRLFVECALWERNDQEALYYLEYVRQAPFLRVPVSLQRVHADVSRRLRHIWVKDFGQEIALRRLLRKLAIYHQLASENSTSEWRII